jgi:hypothetical protein
MRTTAWIVQQDTEAYRYAEEIRAKLNGGRKVTNIEMGQLTAAVYADALGVGEKRTAEEQEAPEDDLGDGGLAGEDTYEQNAVINRIRDKAWRNTVDKASENGIIDSEALQLSSHNMHNSSDALFERYKHVLPVTGYDDVFIHGDQWGVSVKDADGNDIDIPAEEFIKTLKSLRLENDSIRLCACEAGSLDDGIASLVARAINKPVMAPTTLIWITPPNELGVSEMRLYEKLSQVEQTPDYGRPGKWRVFYPDGKIEEIEP